MPRLNHDQTIDHALSQTPRDALDPEASQATMDALDQELTICQTQALKELFIYALQWCEQATAPRSWQRRRLHALLGSMYLEIAHLVDPSSEVRTHPQELLSAHLTWEVTEAPSCPTCHDAQQSARDELRGLLREMIGEVHLEQSITTTRR